MLLLIFPGMILSIAGCKEKKTYKIGVSQCSQDDWREKMNAEIEREIMLHDDAVVEIRSANDNSKRQIEDIRYFADNDFDILIVSPNEAHSLTPVIKEVYDKGIPVIVFDRTINGESYTAVIVADNEGMGRSAAHYALHLLNGNGTAIELSGLPGSTPAKGRHDGFVKEFTDNGGVLLGEAPANWNKADAEKVTDSLLSLYPNVDLIYAHNDRMAIGASEIARKHNRNNIRIIGIDAAPSIGLQAVADSIIDATFLYPTEGDRLIRTALSILKNEPYERSRILPVSSPVDLSNADILLLQDKELKAETEKIRILKAKNDEYIEQHLAQTYLFYACIAIIVLLFGVVFLVLRTYWQHKRHQLALLRQNKELEEQRDMQRELNDKLTEATQSKLMFFTNVSHDLRTPLTLISEPVAQIAVADNLTQQQKTLARIADKNVRILRRLINQILDFRKFENNKLTLNYTEINLGEMIGEWLESFSSVARKRNIRLRLVHPDSADALILAIDVDKIERVFFNLVSNAFKYSPDNSDITVSYTYDDKNVTIRVADTGCGINERDLGNIFDRFYQVDRVHPNGSGIGLSLSKAFVELHGGSITVESELKKGSVFTVSLPIHHVEKKDEEPVKNITQQDVEAELAPFDIEITEDSKNPVILIIDDNKDILRLLSELMKADYSIITASNGAEGVKLALKYVPDLIICDVMMPVMDGLECCRRLKTEVITSHIPVLMLTACSMDEQRVQGYDSGADGYLSKPFNTSVLLARCASLIENRRRIKNIFDKSADTAVSAAPNKETSSQRQLPKNAIDNDFYNRFLDIFYPEMANSELSVDMIASRLGLERSQFYRKIKALTNYSPVELIRNLRLKQAQHLLKTSEKSISEVAYETGFTTPAYFTSCYRKAFGETPTETRTKLTGTP